ncbi:MAG TPA: hypothetical protein VMR16_03995, partial [Candidatus Saccharimonadales bacterium]|nr:hypothetical protein [Candidatus Saccharimonadales bacterium]
GRSALLSAAEYISEPPATSVDGNADAISDDTVEDDEPKIDPIPLANAVIPDNALLAAAKLAADDPVAADAGIGVEVLAGANQLFIVLQKNTKSSKRTTTIVDIFFCRFVIKSSF